MNKKGQEDGVIGFLFVIAFFLLIGIIFTMISISDFGASDGKHTGYVTAIEHNSNFIYPATLVYFKTDAQSSQEDIYCVNDKSSVIEDLNEAQRNKTLVTIKFHNDFIMWKSECNGGLSIIVGVEK